MFALADCNNFYASCERVFRPDLQGKPVIVLSSNDGCAIARSNEAKALGIKMGDPLFKIRDIVNKHNVAVCRSWCSTARLPTGTATSVHCCI